MEETHLQREVNRSCPPEMCTLVLMLVDTQTWQLQVARVYR